MADLLPSFDSFTMSPGERCASDTPVWIDGIEGDARTTAESVRLVEVVRVNLGGIRVVMARERWEQMLAHMTTHNAAAGERWQKKHHESPAKGKDGKSKTKHHQQPETAGLFAEEEL